VPYQFLDKNQKGRRAAFYPDYIIRFKDGSVGIYDTKSGFTADNEHVRQKAEALQRFIREHADLNLKGGIINVKGEYFYLQDSEEYDQDGEWKPFSI
jgi:type III restriction enzyme